MVDVAKLQIRVDSVEAELAEKRLGGLKTESGKTERATDGLTKSFKRLLGPLLGVVSATGALKKLTAITREFDVLNAQLITSTGSAENAAVAFDAIQTFATETPFDLAQVTESFVQLVNRGLDPSVKSITALGNFASAFGKSLGDVTRAVAQASTGEFESLKQLGIVSKKHGDQVTFTFRGVAKTVKFEAQAIQAHLNGLAENNFAGAMTERMNTLDGALSNLGDEWNKLFLSISEEGVGTAIEDSVRTAISVLEELNAQIKSGELEGNILNLRQSFSDWETDITNFSAASDVLFKNLTESAGLASSGIDSTFGHVPQNIRAAIQIMTVELAAFIDKLGAWGSEAGDLINFMDGDTFDLEARIKQIDSARMDSIGAIIEERNAATDRYDTEAEKIALVRKEYDDLQARKSNQEGDPLAAFGVDTSGIDNGETASEAKKRKAGERALEGVMKALRTEEEAIEESYSRRTEIILANTEFASDTQSELLTRASEERVEALSAMQAAETQVRLQGYSQMFDGMAGLAKTFAGEQSGIYKGMFAASKAFAIAESVIKIQQGIASAAALPFPTNIPAMATVAAQTVGIVSQIQGANYSGAYEKGGDIPSGSIGLVGEAGPELIKGPATVTSAKQTKDAFSGGGGGGIQINNLIDMDSLRSAVIGSQEFEETVQNIINVKGA